MTRYQLYNIPISNNGLRAEFVLLEKNIPYDLVTLDFAGGDLKKPEFLAVNPRGQVPCLIDRERNNAVVYESVAIAQYIEQQHPDQNSLYPTDPVDLATCFTRIHEYHQKLDIRNFVGSVVFRGQTLEDLGDRFMAWVKEVHVWDSYLEGREYFANTFSLADIVVFGAFQVYYHVFKLKTEAFPNLGKWYLRCRNRDSIKNHQSFDALTALVDGKYDILKDWMPPSQS